MAEFTYIQLNKDAPLPDLSIKEPFKAILCIEDDVQSQWRSKVSRWLVRVGCLYAMSWGRSCSEWDNSIDDANLEAFDYGEIPEDKLVVTTWHDDEPLSDVIWFSVHTARHSSVELRETLFLHIGEITPRDKQAMSRPDRRQSLRHPHHPPAYARRLASCRAGVCCKDVPHEPPV